MKGFQWCPHCKSPHRLAEVFCPSTGKSMDRVIHRGTLGAAPLAVGMVIDGKYQIGEVLGRGGKGIVFDAVRIHDGKAVAVKVATSYDAEETIRLEREAALLAKLRHPNICAAYGSGFLPGIGPYMVMERLYGQTLSHRARAAGQLRLGEALLLVYQVLSALEFAHACQVVHRDVKPSNVFVTQRAGGPPVAKLLDFGYAKRLHPSARRSLTVPGTVVGTPAYIAPECMRLADASPAADIFAVGVVLFEIVTGTLPWEASSLRDVRAAILAGRRRRLLDVLPDAPESLAKLVDETLSPNPSDRPCSARDMQVRLREVAQRMLGSSRPRPRLARLRQRHPSEDLSASSSSG